MYQTRASQWSRDELETLVSTLGLTGRVGFVDFQPDPSPVYRALDVVVHASTAAEPFGLVIAEAMACGRAVVASDAGGAREIGLPEQTYLVHRPGDAGDLARQLDRLARDGALRRRLGEAAAPAMREGFTIERMGETLHGIYESL
jgi:glycosyltransferase involved in cell wall biosynthesis